MHITTDVFKRIYRRMHINDNTGCWNFNGGDNGLGYKRIYGDDTSHLVHRLMYMVRFGEIPVGKEVHHICGNRGCVRPGHLEAVTHRENVARTQAYERLRRERLPLLIDAYPQLESVGSMTVASTALAALWHCRSDNIPDYLHTLSFLYGEQFQWEMIERGRGPKPSTFRIRIDPALVKELEVSDSHSPVDVLSQMSILPVAV